MKTALAKSLINTVHWVAKQGWCPATSGNFSVRINQQEILITASGRDKKHLSQTDLLLVNLRGEPRRELSSHDDKPSAETPLHTQLYNLDQQIGAVLHTHSIAATVLSRFINRDLLVLSGYEMQKALKGNNSHLHSSELAILDNNQNTHELANVLAERWQTKPLNWGFLLRGHGLYAWGRDIDEARSHLEGLEFLLACELAMYRLNAKN